MKHQGRIAWALELLKEYGLRLSRPYARHLHGKLATAERRMADFLEREGGD